MPTIPWLLGVQDCKDGHALWIGAMAVISALSSQIICEIMCVKRAVFSTECAALLCDIA